MLDAQNFYAEDQENRIQCLEKNLESMQAERGQFRLWLFAGWDPPIQPRDKRTVQALETHWSPRSSKFTPVPAWICAQFLQCWGRRSNWLYSVQGDNHACLLRWLTAMAVWFSLGNMLSNVEWLCFDCSRQFFSTHLSCQRLPFMNVNSRSCPTQAVFLTWPVWLLPVSKFADVPEW